MNFLKARWYNFSLLFALVPAGPGDPVSPILCKDTVVISPAKKPFLVRFAGSHNLPKHDKVFLKLQPVIWIK